MLADLQEQHLRGEKPTVYDDTGNIDDKEACGPAGSSKLSSKLETTNYEKALNAANEILSTMTKQEIASLLTAEGVDFNNITDKDQLNVRVHLHQSISIIEIHDTISIYRKLYAVSWSQN